MESPTKVVQRHERNPALKELDPSTAFLYAPRSISALVLGVVVLIYSAGVFAPLESLAPSQRQSQTNAERGIWAAIFVFIGYSVLQGPTTSMARPHPAVWKAVYGALTVYVLFLVWLLFQEVDDARQFLKHLSPTLGQPIDDRTYAEDCRLYVPGSGWNWAAIKATLYDEFVLAHIIGWWGKALIVRNTFLLWCGSIAFELMELTFKHMLPNFNECWWDRWVLDVLICNYIGIVAGMWTVRYFECTYKQYNWQGFSELSGLKAKAKRSVAQLLPYQWDTFNWMSFESPLRLVQSLVLVLHILVAELNVFFLKHALWIPPRNRLNWLRILLWFLCLIPGVREYYAYLNRKSPEDEVFQKLGMFAWLSLAMSCLETMISIKFGQGLYPRPMPKGTKWLCGMACILFALTMAGWHSQIRQTLKRK